MKDSELIQQMETFNSEFFDLCEVRHNTGAEEYGPLNFLNVDLPKFMYEEMADIANYARFLYIRMRLLEETAREGGFNLSAPFTGEVRDEDKLSFGTTSFVPKQEVSEFLPDEK